MATNQQILEKAIQKAIEGGWHDRNKELQRVRKLHLVDGDVIHAEQLIFNHDFAKAPWGEKLVYDFPLRKLDQYEIDGPYYNKLPAYKAHLRAIVIADDPIKYLEEHM